MIVSCENTKNFFKVKAITLACDTPQRRQLDDLAYQIFVRETSVFYMHGMSRSLVVCVTHHII